MGRKLTTTQQERLLSPIRTAIISMRLGNFDNDQAHNILGQLFIAYRMAQIVPRHRNLLPEIRKADEALYKFITTGHIEDHEIDCIDIAYEIYAGLLKTTPLRVFRRAQINVRESIGKIN